MALSNFATLQPLEDPQQICQNAHGSYLRTGTISISLITLTPIQDNLLTQRPE